MRSKDYQSCSNSQVLIDQSILIETQFTRESLISLRKGGKDIMASNQDGNGKGKRGLGLQGLRVAAAAQPADFNDAVAWLKEVKEELQDDNIKYRKFVQAMQDRKAQRLGIDDLITAVENLFKPRHSHLIAGFHLFFVPPGCSAGRKNILHRKEFNRSIDRSPVAHKKQIDIHHRKDEVRAPMATGGLNNRTEGGQRKHNNLVKINSEMVSTDNAIWIRQMPASQTWKEMVKGHGNGLVEHVEKCLLRCELCAHVKEPVFNCTKTQELAAYQKRAKENLERIYGEILGQGESL